MLSWEKSQSHLFSAPKSTDQHHHSLLIKSNDLHSGNGTMSRRHAFFFTLHDMSNCGGVMLLHLLHLLNLLLLPL
jgi:hypothetical protein